MASRFAPVGWFTHPFRLTALYACASFVSSSIVLLQIQLLSATSWIMGLTQADGEGRTFRAHRIPVIRAAREPPCIGGRTERLAVMQKLEEMAAHALPEQWCMLTVRPGREQDARDSFHRYGIRAYWPSYRFTRWPSRPRERRRADYRSVIPGYLFVPMLPTSTFWDVVERIVGVLNPVRSYSGDIAVLRNTNIEVIRQIEAGLKTPKPGKPLHHFKTGDKIRFVDDLLNRWPPGKFAGATDDGRITAQVRVMGRLVPFQVFPHQIEAA